MFDLIGFWAGVTLYTVPLVFFFYLIFERIVRDEISKITKGKVDWGPWNKWFKDQRYSTKSKVNDLIGVSIVVTLVIWFLAFFGSLVNPDHKDINLIQSISDICEFVSPVTGGVALFGFVWAFYVFVIRKGLISLFNLKEKVDKL